MPATAALGTSDVDAEVVTLNRLKRPYRAKRFDDAHQVVECFERIASAGEIGAVSRTGSRNELVNAIENIR
jgi:hypothetical protein